MHRLEVSDAVRPIYGSLGVRRLIDIVVFHYIPFPVNTSCVHWQIVFFYIYSIISDRFRLVISLHAGTWGITAGTTFVPHTGVNSVMFCKCFQ